MQWFKEELGSSVRTNMEWLSKLVREENHVRVCMCF